MTDTHNRHAPEQPTHDAIPLVTVDTHVVVTVPATVWRTPDSQPAGVTFGDPHLEDDNPFAAPAGEIYDLALEDWATAGQIAARYDLTFTEAEALAIGPCDVMVARTGGSPADGR